MELSAGIQKMSLGQQSTGRGAPCMRCKGKCSGYRPHSWRKSCGCCSCPSEEHLLLSDAEEDFQIGQLLSDSRYSGLTARVKGSEGARVYKRNRMIITNPITSRKDPTFLTVTYEWAPPGLNQKLAMRYMELIPKKMQPVAGTEGSQYRRMQLMRQLPSYDHDPEKCQGLSQQERSAMEEFVRKYKENALGVAEVALPCSAKQQQAEKEGNKTKATNGTEAAEKTEYFCEFCQQPMPGDAPAIYAERAGYDTQWHPACFECCQCRQPLANLIYFWKNNRLWCGRHYCESERPRCTGCDEIIFSQDYKQLEGSYWHNDHFSCVACEQMLNGKSYVLDDARLLCVDCSKAKSSR
ncbi:LIM and cysteine-rich domains protein 1 [Spea bombifrons]|uniref:LIM and cysteine-rich domains protein 1 n=1 Tax=Spea bombifrons TaxID=233779 RepID=UPI00234A9FE3|nr:LIM and cysteine-rich domains protein 1 [Spea bombifrons]